MLRIIGIALLLVCPLTFAQQLKPIEMSPPAAKAPLKRQLGRMDLILQYKMKGFVGEAEDAMLKIHDINGVTPAQKKNIEKNVADENKDRAAILSAVVKHNKLNKEQQGFLVKAAYQTRRNTSPKETYYFENRSWQKKY